jgi:hypothetical protein
MRIRIWSNRDIVAVPRAHGLTEAKLEAFIKTHAPFFDQEAEELDKETCERLGQIADLMQPPEDTHYGATFVRVTTSATADANSACGGRN